VYISLSPCWALPESTQAASFLATGLQEFAEPETDPANPYSDVASKAANQQYLSPREETALVDDILRMSEPG
jgi:hypothetical protein